MKFTWGRYALLVALAGWLALSGARAIAGDAATQTEVKDVSIVVGGEPYTGSLLLPASDSGFKFRLNETGDVMRFRWSSLEQSERRRIQKLMGIEVEDGRLAFGKTLDCLRFQLKSSKSYEGLELPDRALPGYRCLKTATQVVQIPKSDIEKEEKIEKRESDVFSAEEVYDRMLLERPPSSDSAKDHLDYARQCANMGLYDKGIDHLEMAKAVDPRIEERTQEFREELVVKYADQQAEKMYLQIMTDLRAGDNATALAKIQRLKDNFPNSEYYTKVDSLQTKVEADTQVDFQKQVIFMYYNLFNELVQERIAKRVRVDEKGRPVPSIPGKQVTTRQGHIFRGVLVSDDTEKLVLKQDELNVTIPAKDILTKQDVDLSKSARAVEPTFAELKQYVTDAQGGIGKELIAKISARLKVDEAKVRDAWGGRFNQTAEYKDGQLVKSKTYVTLHEAPYGKGSWLRDGVQAVQANPQGQGQGRNQGGRNQGGRNNNTGGQNGGSNLVAAEQEVNPDDSDDPEIWWKGQSSNVKFNLLRGMAVEKLFKVKDIKGDRCSQCAGKGYVEIWDGYGSLSQYRCPTCRGLTALFRVFYE
ncbi:MAG: hypothetical protein M5U26_07195 [Planctomycetota bacterium]|nr:hypothetical protein [Planctomycetota bacterium]